MYDWPEVHWAHDALWTAIAARLNAAGVEVPATLDRARLADDMWADRRLVLSQTCGYPYATRLRGSVRLVGTPVYDVEGCEGPLYSSAIVARRGESGERLSDFPGRLFAFNRRDSLSGYVGPRAAMREAGLDLKSFRWTETASHRASVRAIADGLADIAAIDAVCWALANEHEAEAAGRLKVLEWTRKRPGLPFVTARGRSATELKHLRSAIAAALADPETAAARRALHLAGVTIVEETDYLPIAALSAE
jgi:ABC-type phosphate/phosphonate transport system substrate-binding protein